tara:strand:+ start:206 stop:499 length:294 start_codon:yes stop_codon:yes gene_type:complete
MENQARLQTIRDAGYTVLLMLGGYLNDFPGLQTWHESNPVRNAAVVEQQSAFGERFILLPNTVYGDWEGGMADGYHWLSAREQLQLRQRRLRSWSGL